MFSLPPIDRPRSLNLWLEQAPPFSSWKYVFLERRYFEILLELLQLLTTVTHMDKTDLCSLGHFEDPRWAKVEALAAQRACGASLSAQNANLSERR